MYAKTHAYHWSCKFCLRSEYKTLEFKYLVAQEKIEQLQKEAKEGSKNSSRSSDVMTQTNGCYTNNKSCQTDSTEMMSYESLAYSQADTSTTQEIPVQINDAVETQSKKRKICSESESTSTATEQSDVDASILKSEVYKIYHQNKDPKEAMKQIKALKNCLLFEEAKTPLPSDTELKSIFDDALKELWTFGSSDFIAIKRFIQGYTKEDSNGDHDGSLSVDGKLETIIFDCFTRIKMLLPNGIEYWYVKNFANGPKRSKWYRGFSVAYFLNDREFAYPGESSGDRIAVLNVIGLTNSMIERIYVDHIQKEHRLTPAWDHFALTFLDDNLKSLFPDTNLQGWTFDVKETKTETLIETIATLRILRYDDDKKSILHTFKSFYGKSTCPLETTRRPTKEMVVEAKEAALKHFFREKFGFTVFEDVEVDEFYRFIIEI